MYFFIHYFSVQLGGVGAHGTIGGDTSLVVHSVIHNTSNTIQCKHSVMVCTLLTSSETDFTYLPSAKRSCWKVMFSVVSVCHFCSRGSGGPHVTIIHDALDLTIQPLSMTSLYRDPPQTRELTVQGSFSKHGISLYRDPFSNMRPHCTGTPYSLPPASNI